MEFLRFILRNAFRNKKRTALTVLSTGFSLFLLIALTTFHDILTNPPQSEAGALRLAVRRSTAITEDMPISYLDKLKRVPHVDLAVPMQWFGGVYKEPKNFFGNLAVDKDHFWSMFPELATSDEARRRFAAHRDAAIVGTGLAERFGWKLGDRVTLLGTIFPVDLDFQIVGFYEYELDRFNLYFRWDYLNEALGKYNRVGSFWLKADRPDSVPMICDTVDAMFRNTAAETKTETEKAFVLGFVAMLGNVKMLVAMIAGVVVFTMLLVSASTMAMTIRERMREVAILKAMGFSRNSVLLMVLGESVFLALLGFALGLGFAYGLHSLDVYQLTKGFIGYFSPPLEVYIEALVAALVVGLVSGLFPALQASRMTILHAMRKLE